MLPLGRVCSPAARPAGPWVPSSRTVCRMAALCSLPNSRGAAGPPGTATVRAVGHVASASQEHLVLAHSSPSHAPAREGD